MRAARGRRGRRSRNRRVGRSGQPPQLKRPRGHTRREVRDPRSVRCPGRLRDQLIGDDVLAGAQCRTVPRGHGQVGQLLLVSADHRDLGSIRRDRRVAAVFPRSGQRLARSVGAVGKPQPADQLLVGPVIVLGVDNPARDRDRLNVAAGVVRGVGPQLALRDRAPEWHRPDRQHHVVVELRLVVRHPQRLAVGAEARIERPMVLACVVGKPRRRRVARHLAHHRAEPVEDVDVRVQRRLLDRDDRAAVR